jgi:hypothetical protein
MQQRITLTFKGRGHGATASQPKYQPIEAWSLVHCRAAAALVVLPIAAALSL